MAEPSYVLGHTEGELARLARQALLIDPITRGLSGISCGLGIMGTKEPRCRDAKNLKIP